MKLTQEMQKHNLLLTRCSGGVLNRGIELKRFRYIEIGDKVRVGRIRISLLVIVEQFWLSISGRLFPWIKI